MATLSVAMNEHVINEALVVTPCTSKSDQLPVIRKRKVTPSSELSSPNKSLILSPQGAISSQTIVFRLSESPIFAPSKRLFPSGEAEIKSRFSLRTTDANPESPESSTQQIQIPPSRHIILPFNLRQNQAAFHGVNIEILFRLFPDTKSVSFDGHFLVFWLSPLPPKPWPVTIAGVQPYFTIDSNDDGPTPPIKRASKSIFRVSAEIDAKHLAPDKLDGAFELVKNFFAQAEILITEVQYWNIFWVIVLENEETDLGKVPSAIGRCRCFYLFENEMGRPRPDEFPARQICDPTDNIVDNSEYDILRPGVMLSSGKDPATGIECLTSSGVLVEDSQGNRYMTVASHGFPHGDIVFHPSAGRKDIGQLTMKISHTDVALVKLHNEIQFVNEIFESALEGVAPIQLQAFMPANDTEIGSFLYMNNPFTGYSEGSCGPHTRTRVPSDDPNVPSLEWIRTRWVYLGQGFTDKLQGSVCGSAIWNDDGKVIGFFRYAPRSGHFKDWCHTVASDNVIERGFEIAV